MAAPFPPRDRNDKPHGEENGRGGFGKFRKRPFQRTTQATPYDRPPTSIRNFKNFASNSSAGNKNGWLSKLVDPAQRLITASAHRLFASVFRKRLHPPPPQPPETEAKGGARDKQKEAVPIDRISTPGAAANGCDNPSSSSDRGGITDLELILKQKTFTKSEIDRLTALLQSRTVDLPFGHEESKFEVIPSKAVLSQDRKEGLPNTPVKDSGIEACLSAPIVRSSVLEEDVASPTELAKAYMGSRPSKVSPSMLGLHSQPLKDNSIVPMNPPISSKSPIMSVVPRSSGHTGFPDNGLVTPRSCRRSAIYSMARTPYSRVHTTTILQGSGAVTESVGGSSSSQRTWENNRFSGSKQGALKRRSSILDNDIRSAGPIRRIRQKSNLFPASGALSVRGTGLVSDSAKQQSSSEKPLLLGEPTTEIGDNSFHGSGFTPIPSKSSEMASKILQQLNVLVTSREKSPAKLSPSMLRGPALKSLEHVDSSKFVVKIRDNNQLDANNCTSLPDERESLSQKQHKSEENGPIKSNASPVKSVSAVNGVDSSSVTKNNVSSDKATAISVMNPVLQSPIQKKRAFQMSAHEDYLDLDDDYFNGTANTTLAEGSEKLDATLAESKNSVLEAVTVEKPLALTSVNPPSGSALEQKTIGGDGDKCSSFTFPVAPPSAGTIMQTAVDGNSTAVSDKDALREESNDPHHISGFEDKIVSPKEPNGVLPLFNFGGKLGNEVSPIAFSSSSIVADSSGVEFGTLADPKPESSSYFPVAARATETLATEPGSHNADNKNSLKANVFRLPEALTSAASTSTASLFQFGITANTSSLNNESTATIPSIFSQTPPLVSDGVINQSSSSGPTSVAGSSGNASAITITTANVGSSSSSPLSSSVLSFVGAPLSKSLLSVVPSTPASPVSTTIEFKEAKTIETSLGDPVSTSFGGTASAVSVSLFGGMPSINASTGNNIFGGTSVMMSSGGNIFGGTSAMASSNGNIFAGTSALTSSGGNIFGGTSAMTSSGSSIGGTSVVASTGSGLFLFDGGATTSAASNQSEGFNPFSGASAPASTAGAGLATSTQSMPIQFGSSASSPSLGLTGNTTFSSTNSFLSSSISTSEPFSSSTFGLTPSMSSSGASSVSSSSSNASVFGSSWQAPKAPTWGSSFNSTSSAPLSSFGASQTSNAATSSTPVLFGSSTSASSGSFPPFSSPAVVTPSQPGFANANPSFAFGSVQSGNNDQMSMEENMAEDTVPANMPTVPVFDQRPISTSFVFGSTAPSGGNQFGSSSLTGANPFQFGSQSNHAGPQNPSPFQASGSLAGGSFSVGAGGGDKATRKFVKVRKTQRKK